ncbi:hypothetical protein FO519_006739 [Halicephalobus sp. NKZ332]|nr:hypothetical protein FO519_006739 [Halicephalobus sp. NKZ332]
MTNTPSTREPLAVDAVDAMDVVAAMDAEPNAEEPEPKENLAVPTDANAVKSMAIAVLNFKMSHKLGVLIQGEAPMSDTESEYEEELPPTTNKPAVNVVYSSSSEEQQENDVTSKSEIEVLDDARKVSPSTNLKERKI